MKVFQKSIVIASLFALFATGMVYANEYESNFRYGIRYGLEGSHLIVREELHIICSYGIDGERIEILSAKEGKVVAAIDHFAEQAMIGTKKIYYPVQSADGLGMDMMELDLKTKKTRKIGTMEDPFGNGMRILWGTVKDDHLYFQNEEYETRQFARSPLYKMSLKDGKVSKVLEDGGSLKYGADRIFFGISAQGAYTLKRATYTGAHVKEVGKNVIAHEAIGKKVYYIEQKDGKCMLYSMNQDGTGKKKELATSFRADWIVHITDKEILFVKGQQKNGEPKFFKKTIASNKDVEIENPYKIPTDKKIKG